MVPVSLQFVIVSAKNGERNKKEGKPGWKGKEKGVPDWMVTIADLNQKLGRMSLPYTPCGAALGPKWNRCFNANKGVLIVAGTDVIKSSVIYGGARLL